MAAILKTNRITKIYGSQRAVDDVSLTISRGDIYGLIGRNGAGKTTLMKMISGLAQPTGGDYEIFGHEAKGSSQGMTRIGCLIENTGIYPNLTAYDHLQLKKLAMGLHEKKLEDNLLTLVGLADTGKKKVKQFSLGMKQRLGIALALVGYPDLVILDEPINGLDPQGIVEVRNLIEKLNREEGITFIISSHILDELARLASRFGIINRGRLVDEVSQEELRERNSDYIELETPLVAEASVALDAIGVTTYKVISDKSIHIFEASHKIPEISLALAQERIPIELFTVHKNSLEDYYLRLTGDSKELV